MLRQYNGKSTNIENTDLATNYLGYWMDNGAYYYYNPLPSTSYQVVVGGLHKPDLPCPPLSGFFESKSPSKITPQIVFKKCCQKIINFGPKK